MQIKPDEITNILKSRIQGLDVEGADLAEVGTVLSVADGIARVHGLENCMSFELLEFPHDVTGLALHSLDALAQDACDLVRLDVHQVCLL